MSLLRMWLVEIHSQAPEHTISQIPTSLAQSPFSLFECDLTLSLINDLIPHMSIINLTPKQLRRAASIKETIEELQNELNKLAGGSTTPAKTTKPKRRMSAAGRVNIRAAVKARWAKVKSAT
jgi:hypothetical protein